jgi:hypothetical protein
MSGDPGWADGFRSRPFGSFVAPDHTGKIGIGAGDDVTAHSRNNVLRSVNALSSLGSDERPFLAELLP